MLSLFPSLLSWSIISPLILRITLAAILIYWAYKVFRNIQNTSQQKGIAVIEGVAGILMLIGLWTQGAALVIIVDLIIRLVAKIKSRSFLTDGVNYYLLMLVIAISLLLTGPGILSFDLPL